MKRCDVLIVGAGPTGLVLALWLTKLGVEVRIIDRTSGPGTTSRALDVQARTLELYQQLDLSDEVIRRGHETPAVNFWVRGKAVSRVPFEAFGAGQTRYPFLQTLPQDEHERLLIARLDGLGIAVEREVSLVAFQDRDGGVTARLQGPDGAETVCEAAYIAGCDGARSRVREILAIRFLGGTYRQLFYVADVQANGPAIDGELHFDLDEADFLGVFPLAGTGRARLIGTVRDARASTAEALTFEDISDRAIGNLKVAVERVNWFSTYRVHHRVAERFRRGRAFLLGDAAHIHSPAGGQGMNTGIGDAINLAWKLAAVVVGHAPETLLDSYEVERIGFARRLVTTTDRVFSFVSAQGALARVLRTWIAPVLIPAVVGVRAVRRYLFRTLGQITLNYRGGPLSVGKAGGVRGGDRLPWAPTPAADNFTPPAAMTWQVHVYGEARTALVRWCAEHGLAIHVFDWCEAYRKAGLARGAAYLLRPDSYVALADPQGGPVAIARYFSTRGVQPGPQPAARGPLRATEPAHVA